MVRVTGFEPAASCSQSRRATSCATPGYEVVGWPGRILPNVARYQLRYTPIFLSSVFYCRAWRASGCHVSRCGGLGAALHRSHGRPALPPRCFRRWRRSAACTNCATPRYSFLLFFTAARGAVALFIIGAVPPVFRHGAAAVRAGHTKPCAYCLL